MLVKLTSGLNFTNLLVQSANAPAQRVWHNQFYQQNSTNFILHTTRSYTQLLCSATYGSKYNVILLSQKLLIKCWWNWPLKTEDKSDGNANLIKRFLFTTSQLRKWFNLPSSNLEDRGLKQVFHADQYDSCNSRQQKRASIHKMINFFFNVDENCEPQPIFFGVVWPTSPCCPNLPLKTSEFDTPALRASLIRC